MAVVRGIRQLPIRTVLDAGCGAGTLSGYLAAAGLEVLSVDESQAMLRLARQRVPDIHGLQADITHVQLPKPVDCAVIALTLHEMNESKRQAVWHALQGLIRPNGLCVVMDYTLPPRRTCAGDIARRVIDWDEGMVDRDDPGHYHNYQDFMCKGGARGWLTGMGVRPVHEEYHLFGNLGVFHVERKVNTSTSLPP